MRRNKALAKAIRANAMEYMACNASVPRQYHLVRGSTLLKLKIERPKFKDIEEYLKDTTDDRPFVDLNFDYNDWLFNFAGDILDTKADNSIPIRSAKRDYENPGMSAFRVVKDDAYFQVQVRKIPEFQGMFQLDYFEPTAHNGVELRMVLVCDVSDPQDTSVDVVYANGVGRNNWTIYASKISTVFRDMLIYLRVWDYSVDCKYCFIIPFPEKIFC